MANKFSSNFYHKLFDCFLAQWLSYGVRSGSHILEFCIDLCKKKKKEYNNKNNRNFLRVTRTLRVRWLFNSLSQIRNEWMKWHSSPLFSITPHSSFIFNSIGGYINSLFYPLKTQPSKIYDNDSFVVLLKTHHTPIFKR